MSPILYRREEDSRYGWTRGTFQKARICIKEVAELQQAHEFFFCGLLLCIGEIKRDNTEYGH